MTRTQVYLDDNAYIQAQLLARQMSVPTAALIRKYVNQGIKNDLGKRETVRDSLMRIAKHAYKGKDAPNDLSINHDDYLYGDK
jgi:hypothetical protein